MTYTNDLALDRKVLIWVFIPLTLSVLLMMLLRQFAHKLVSFGNKSQKKEMKEIREMQALAKSQKLRESGHWITLHAFNQRKAMFISKSDDNNKGIFYQEVETKSIHETMATDPSMMMNMFKTQLTGLIPQILMGTWVNYFFAGFVMGKVPLSLSPRFRPMLQRGIDLASLDVSYFTSLSYYIILLFGIRGLFSLFFREDTIDDTQFMRKQMNPLETTGPGFDIKKAFDTERDLLELYDHYWMLTNIDIRTKKVLERFLKS